MHNQGRNDDIYRFANSVVVVVIAFLCYDYHSHLVYVRNMFAVQLYVFGMCIEK